MLPEHRHQLCLDVTIECRVIALVESWGDPAVGLCYTHTHTHTHIRIRTRTRMRQRERERERERETERERPRDRDRDRDRETVYAPQSLQASATSAAM